MEYKGYPVEIIRSSRKTLSLEIVSGPSLRIRAPYRMPLRDIRAFMAQKSGWLDAHLARAEMREERVEAAGRLSEEELDRLADLAVDYFSAGVARLAPKVGVTYGRITIRWQKTRWGSCSSKGNLNFNALLMLAPPEVRDYVIVHELCHRLEMNHSPRFWAEVARVMPDYRDRLKWLKTHGSELMAAGGLR